MRDWLKCFSENKKTLHLEYGKERRVNNQSLAMD